MDPQGSLEPSFDNVSQLSGVFSSPTLLPDGSLLLLGAERSSLVRLFKDGTADSQFHKNFPGGSPTFVHVLRDGRILVGGFGVQAQGHLAKLVRLFQDGSIDPSFQFYSDYEVSTALEQDDGTLLIGGHFTYVNGIRRGGFAKIHNNDYVSPAVLKWNGAIFGVQEKSPYAQIPIFRTGEINSALTCFYKTRAGTAFPDEDFVMSEGTVEFLPGELSQYLSIPLKDDFDPEADEIFEVLLSSTEHFDSPSIARVTIISEEGKLGFSTDLVVASEIEAGAPLELIRNGATPYPIACELVVGESTATNPLDYGLNSLHQVAPFASSSTVSLPLRDDTLVETDEFIRIQLKVPLPHQVQDLSETEIVIRDNDRSFYPGEGVAGLLRIWPLQNGGLLADGIFSTFSGIETPSPVRLNSHGLLDQSFHPQPLFNSYLELAFPDSSLLYAIKNSGGNPYSRHVLLKPDGTVHPSFNPNLVSGYWATAHILPNNHFLLLDRTGDGAWYISTYDSRGTKVWAATNVVFGSSTPPAVAFQSDGKLIVGGQVFTYRGDPRNARDFSALTRDLVRVNLDGTIDLAFQVLAAGGTIAHVTVLPGDALLLRGNFQSLNGIPRPGLAIVEKNGELRASFNPTHLRNKNLARSILLPGDKILLMLANFDGTFDLLRLNPGGDLDPSFQTVHIIGAVTSLVQLFDQRIVISGYVTSVNNTPRMGLAYLSPEGILLPDYPLAITQFRPDSNGFYIELSARAEGEVIIEASSNFQTWTPLSTNAVSLDPTVLTLPFALESPQFLRARALAN